MLSGTRQFSPQTIPTVIMVFLLPIFCGLGIWQLERAEQKLQLASALESRRKLPATSLNRQVVDSDGWEFRRIRAEGRFTADKTVLIENRKHLGQSGFHVITPLRLEQSGQVVLINRGWIPREHLAEASPLPTPPGLVSVNGEIRHPQPPALELEFSEWGAEGLPRWPYLTLEHYARWSGLEILPFAVLQSAEDDSGFVRAWPQPRFSDTLHIGYAIQWFAFALISLLIWLRLSYAKQAGPETSS
jgi:surfeit locus 1 family protein